MSDAAAVLLTADDGSGEAFELADPRQLQGSSLILSDPTTGRMLLVDREQFMQSHSVTVEGKKETTGKPQPRRRFGRKGKN